MSDFLDKIKDRATEAKDNLLDKLGLVRNEWPQTSAQPPFGVKGFLPPQLITPTIKLVGDKDAEKSLDSKPSDNQSMTEKAVSKKEPGGYTYTDWMGYKITENDEYKLSTKLKTKDRFNLGINIPKDSETLKKDPYSSRDVLLLYNDSTQITSNMVSKQFII